MPRAIPLAVSLLLLMVVASHAQPKQAEEKTFGDWTTYEEAMSLRVEESRGGGLWFAFVERKKPQ